MAGAGYGIPDGSGGYVTKLEGDGDAKIGDSSGDVLQITGSVEQLGTSLKISGDDARVKINGDTDSHPGLEFHENGSRHWIIYNDYTTDNLTFKSSADRVVITDSGRLGIGTTSPDYKLDVAGNISLNEHIYHNGDPNTRFSFPNPDEINIVAGGNSVLKFESNTILLNNSNQNFDTKVMADNGQVVLHVDAGTNRVGIGTTSPNYALDVAGNIGVDQYIYHNGDDNTFISFTDDDINIQAGGVNFIDITEGANNEITFNEAGADIDFRVEGDTDTHLLFVEGGTDRVGIGTSSPSVELDVGGSANISGQFARGVASVNLGSGTTSTLNPATSGAGTLLVTASSITTPTSGGSEMMHICSLADGTIAGQVLTIIIVSNFLTGAGGASDMGVLLIAPNTPLNSSTGIVTFTGSAAGGNPQGCTAVLMWTGSAWAILSTRRGGGSA